ncbi:hypothetical protein Pmar_PMAR026345, partial [Perkinsus marinus ATCC 50983]
VWQRRNCSVLEEIQLLSAKQWETLIEQAGLSLPTKLSAVTVSQLAESDFFHSEFIRQCIDSVKESTSS